MRSFYFNLEESVRGVNSSDVYNYDDGGVFDNVERIGCVVLIVQSLKYEPQLVATAVESVAFVRLERSATQIYPRGI